MLVLFGAIFAAIVYRWISLERLQHVAPVEVTATPIPEPTPTRPPVITGKLDTAKLFNGITLHSTIETLPGADASTERAEPDSYVLDLKLQARVPSPNKTIEELAKVSPQLPALLPGLADDVGSRSGFTPLRSALRHKNQESCGRISCVSIDSLPATIFSIARPCCNWSTRRVIARRS